MAQAPILDRKKAPMTDRDHLYWLHYRTLESFIARQLPELPTPLLDLGCGARPYRSMYPTGKIVGADIFESDIVDLTIAIDGSLRFRDNEFGSVFSTQVLEHVYDTQSFLAEAYRVTRPGGRLLLTVPFVWELHEEPHDFLRFSRYWLDRKLREIGYTSILIQPQGGDIAMIGQVILLVMARRKKFFSTQVLKLFNQAFDWADRRSPTNFFPLNYGVTAVK